MIISIDGAAGTGKTTVGKIVANKLNYQFLDSGKIYRAYTLKMIKKNIFNTNNIIDQLSSTEIKYIYKNNEEILDLDGIDVSNNLHSDLVDKHVSEVSKIPEIRLKMTDLQRKIVKKDFIVVGRDIGSVVLPNAELKIFLTASIEERAKRRFHERKNGSLDEIENSIKKRDLIDSTRKVAPLKIPKKAIVIDTENKNIDTVCQEIIKMVK
ncbi:MAG: (d)CMP kinase [Dehalococcoidia bacterium]|tara:strand:+ start:663 stop:1292 length:630 start_codon:yes stop_codon:yes gene_type:complete